MNTLVMVSAVFLLGVVLGALGASHGVSRWARRHPFAMLSTALWGRPERPLVVIGYLVQDLIYNGHIPEDIREAAFHVLGEGSTESDYIKGENRHVSDHWPPGGIFGGRLP